MMILSMAIDGFLLDLTAKGRSMHTVDEYRTNLRKLQVFLGDVKIEDVSTDDVRRFLASLREDLAPKTLKNVHTTCSSFWTWAVKESVVQDHVVRRIDSPRAKAPVIQPFTEDEIKALLHSCDRTAKWTSHRSGSETATRRKSALRDRALLLFLLDTGARASEVCDLTIGKITLASGQALVLGKGEKERLVYFGKRTRQTLWRYWATREHMEPTAPAFATEWDGERALNRDVLYKLIARIGERAGVKESFPHRFRHTFSITFLRNGGDIFTLQRILGHSTLDMVKRYSTIADSDSERVHQKASPVDNWHL